MVVLPFTRAKAMQLLLDFPWRSSRRTSGPFGMSSQSTKKASYLRRKQNVAGLFELFERSRSILAASRTRRIVRCTSGSRLRRSACKSHTRKRLSEAAYCGQVTNVTGLPQSGDCTFGLRFLSTCKKMVYLSLGSNLGDREANLREAMQRLEELGVIKAFLRSMRPSRWRWRARQPWFLNCAMGWKPS